MTEKGLEALDMPADMSAKPADVSAPRRAAPDLARAPAQAQEEPIQGGPYPLDNPGPAPTWIASASVMTGGDTGADMSAELSDVTAELRTPHKSQG